MYRLLFIVLRLISRLPLRIHYFLSDVVLYPLAYYIVGYRRKLVRRQLEECFPEQSKAERRRTERRFYHFLCDIIVEIVKMGAMSHEEMRRRVEFVGIPEMQETLKREGKQFGFFYLGHYGNWEWLSSFPLWLDPVWQGAQIYHPLKNQAIDCFFLDQREQYGGICIPMKQTLRQILTARRQGGHEIIGFIADQSPKWQAMHHWTDFLGHPTSFFIGTEKIARQVDAALYYVHVTRPRRGYYRAELVPITLHPAEYAKENIDEMGDFPATDSYASMLEAQIRECPELWLWTHDRWKRTYGEWIERQNNTSRDLTRAMLQST